MLDEVARIIVQAVLYGLTAVRRIGCQELQTPRTCLVEDVIGEVSDGAGVVAGVALPEEGCRDPVTHVEGIVVYLRHAGTRIGYPVMEKTLLLVIIGAVTRSGCIRARVPRPVVHRDVVADDRVGLVAHEEHEAATVVVAVIVLVGDSVAAHIDVEGLAVVIPMGIAVDLVELKEDVLAGHGPDGRVVLGSVVRVAGPHHGIALNQPLRLVL